MEGHLANHIDWPGKSGKVYRYFFVDLKKPIKAAAANYAFVKRLANGNFQPLYFGETGDAKQRLTSPHEKWEAAKRAGVTHVMGHATQGGEEVRCAEERDLIERWQPVLNVQHRKVL